MNKSKTPLTDEAIIRAQDKYHRLYPDSKNYPVDSDFAKELELGLADANERIALLQFLVKADTIALEKIRDEIGVDNLRDIYFGKSV